MAVEVAVVPSSSTKAVLMEVGGFSRSLSSCQDRTDTIDVFLVCLLRHTGHHNKALKQHPLRINPRWLIPNRCRRNDNMR